MEQFIQILEFIAMIVCGFMSFYFKKSEQAQTLAKNVAEITSIIQKNTNHYITKAEQEYKDTTKAGGAKFNYVVDHLYSLIPENLRSIFTRDMIEDTVQRSFDEIKDFTQIQLDSMISEINNG